MPSSTDKVFIVHTPITKWNRKQFVFVYFSLVRSTFVTEGNEIVIERRAALYGFMFCQMDENYTRFLIILLHATQSKYYIF